MEYNFFKRTSFIFMVLFYVISLFYFFVPSKYCLPFSYYLICTLLLIFSIVQFTLLSKKNGDSSQYYLDMYEALNTGIIGVVALNFGQKYYILSIILGILYLVPLIIRIFVSRIKINQVFLDSIKYMFAIILILANAQVVAWSRFVIGIIYFAVGSIILYTKFKHLNEYKKGGSRYE